MAEGASATSPIGRTARLDAARRIDWRFLLEDPSLDSVACVEPAEPALLDALATLDIRAATGTAGGLARTRQQWRVVLLSDGSMAAEDVSAAISLVEPGGWLVIELPRGARARGVIRRLDGALRSPSVERVRRYWLLPSRAMATRIALLDDPVAVRAALGRPAGRMRRRAAGWIARTMASAAPPDLLGGDLTVIARMAGPQGTEAASLVGPLASVVADWPDVERSSAIVLTPRFRASAHVLVLYSGADGKTRLVAKVGRLPGDGASLAREAWLLEQVGASSAAGSVPRVVAIDRIGGHDVMLQTGLVGRPLDRAVVRRDPRRWIAAVQGWLARLPATEANASFDGIAIDEALAQIDAWLGSTPNQELVERARTLLRILEGHAIRRPFEHGDLSHPNILILDGGLLGVLDWEHAEPVGMPVHDLCFFLGYVALATAPEREQPFDGFLRVVAHPEWGAAIAIRSEADRLRVPPDLLAGLVLACWTRTLARVIATGPPERNVDASGAVTDDRYYALWEGAILQHERLTSLLS